MSEINRPPSSTQKNKRYSPAPTSPKGIAVIATVITLSASVFVAGVIYQTVNGWKCLMLSLLHIPCPGCGLTRATLSFLFGHPSAAFSYHPLFFVPFLMLGLGILSIPLKTRRKTIYITVLLLAAAMLVCWIIRLACGWRGYI